MSPSPRALSSVFALTPSRWRMTSLRLNRARPLELGEDGQVIGRARGERPRPMSGRNGSGSVDRVQLLGGPVRAPQPVCQLDQAGVVRGGADPAPQPKPGRPERVEVAGDKG